MQLKKTFLIAVIVSVITHFYAYTNLIINHDGVNAFVSGESFSHIIGLGRFMQIFLLKLSTTPCLPAVIGVISTLSISATCCLLVILFDIKSNIGIFLTSAVVITFPVVANTFCYMFTADAYFLSMALAVLAVWLLTQYPVKGMIPSIILLLIVCGTYQTYWSFAAVLLFTSWFWHFITGKHDFITWVKRGLLYLVPLLSSIISYLLLNKLVQSLFHINASSYQGLNNMGFLRNPRELYWTSRFAYQQYIKYFFKFGSMVPSKALVIVNIVLLLITLLLLVKLFFSSRRRKWYETIVFAIILFLCPVILNLLSILSKNNLHAVMMFAFAIPYIISIAVVESGVALSFKSWFKASRIIALAMVAVVAFSGYLITNKIYVRQQLNYEATYSYMTRLLMRIEESPEYESGDPVCFINSSRLEKEHIRLFTLNYPDSMSEFDDLNDMVGVNQRTMVKNEKDIFDFMSTFLGTYINRADTDARINCMSSPAFEVMPTYPASDSIKKIDGTVVVKLPD